MTLDFASYSPRNPFSGRATILHPCGSVEELSTEHSWDTYEEYIASHEAEMRILRGKE